MAVRSAVADDIEVLNLEIDTLLSELGTGKVEGVAYDTAWVARLAPRYPGYGFDKSLEWLRWNQHPDGTWGAPLVHYHDRFVSTLAAIVALRDAGNNAHDRPRIKRGENALWQLAGKLGRDDSDTVGFPIVSTALAQEALSLGLDVPLPPLRYAEAYRKKVEALLKLPHRDWRDSPMSHSLEALRQVVAAEDKLLAGNFSVGISPAATAAYLLEFDNKWALGYLTEIQNAIGTGAMSAVGPIDVFEIAWSLNHLARAHAITPDDPRVRRLIDTLLENYSPQKGASPSSRFAVTDIDDTAGVFTVLRWAGIPVTADVFNYFETDGAFVCYHGETNPSLSAQVRLLSALKMCTDHPAQGIWIKKAVRTLRTLDDNRSYWWDKWHASPYYVNGASLSATKGIADDLSESRLKWILRTQREDGGWGYLGQSTQEETAYCLEALLFWDRAVKRVDSEVLERANAFLRKHVQNPSYTPLWIGKSLYTPHLVVKAAVLGALYRYAICNR
ncbi:MAG: hypothetical protein KJ065_19355 [Anaerolineae bacterium]|nr:hypothetical protein [Anaerolineae bacterium]